MDKQTAIGKIRKCLALAKSSEPHEAASAMRQAQKLMKEFGIEHPELLAAGADEQWTKSSASNTPTRYEVALASLCASAYGCEIIFSRRLSDRSLSIDGGYTFVGVVPAPEICKYTFEVFVRQLRGARRVYVSTALKRCGPRNKTARADEFCEGWVTAVRHLIRAEEPTDSQRLLIDAYMRANYASTASFSPRSRAVIRGSSTLRDRVAGFAEGANATVRPGVSKADSPLALGDASGGYQ